MSGKYSTKWDKTDKNSSSTNLLFFKDQKFFLNLGIENFLGAPVDFFEVEVTEKVVDQCFKLLWGQMTLYTRNNWAHVGVKYKYKHFWYRFLSMLDQDLSLWKKALHMLNHLPEARTQSMMESRKRSKRAFWHTHIDKSGVNRRNTLGYLYQYMAQHRRIVKQSYCETV